MNRILFVGNILSKHKGGKNIAEKLADLLGEDRPVKAVSNKLNKGYRFIDIFISCLFGNYDILIADTYSGQAITIAYISSFVAKFRKKKIVLVLRGGRLAEYHSLREKFVNKIFCRANLIITPSLFLMNYFKVKGFNVDYLPNFIDDNIFYDRKERRIQHSILWVRAFNHIYKPTLAVKVLKCVLEKYPDATLTMIGPDDGLLNDTVNFAHELGVIDSINFIGPVKNIDLPAYYSTHSVYINTTTYESFGMSVMEAAACGLPIVSNSVGELPLLWKHKSEIFLVDKFDEFEFAKYIYELYENPDIFNQISKAASEKSKKFGWNIIKNEWENIFNL